MKQGKRAKRRQEQGLDKMVAASQKLGLYDTELLGVPAKRRRRLKRSEVERIQRSTRTLTLDELIAQLQAQREQLGGHVPVIVGERGTELAYAVDVVRWRDLEDAEAEYTAARICGV